MLQVANSDRKNKTEASSKTAEPLAEQESQAHLQRWMGRSRQSNPLQQRSSLSALQKKSGNQAVLRMSREEKGRSHVANPMQEVAKGGCPLCQVDAAISSKRILPIQMPLARWASHVDIPAFGEPDEIVDEPKGDSATPAPVPKASEGCRQPISMNKLTSGTFLGGLTMDSYFPDLAGSGTYAHPATGGTFDTGSRAGANIQLYGVIPSPCLPNQFQLEQTIKRTRFRIGGIVHPEEGKTFDDIAKSGRDASSPPFRQEFLGGGSAPLGYIISMADPPSTGYTSTSNIEHDRDFVTSLVGPSGRQSVSWSLSTRISGGVVTSNILT